MYSFGDDADPSLSSVLVQRRSRRSRFAKRASRLTRTVWSGILFVIGGRFVLKFMRSAALRRRFSQLSPHERYAVGLFALIFVSSVAALSVQLYLSHTEAVPAFGGDYREAVVGTPRFVNPVLAPKDVDRALALLVYPSLMRYDTSGEIMPAIAETYEIVDEGRTYRFKLRTGLVWEDGEPITADDIAFTIGRIQDAQFVSPLLQNWQGVRVSTEGTDRVIFQLSSAYTPFLENTTVGILPKHKWENIPAESFALSDLNIEPVGGGPFIFDELTRDSESGIISSYTVKRNDTYYGKHPYLNSITLKFYETELDALVAYNRRSVDGIASVSPLNLSLFSDAHALALYEFHMPRYFALFFNEQENAILQDIRVRRALALATNRDELIADALGGYAQKTDGPIPPTLSQYYNSDLAALDFNPDEARSILDDANWIDSDGDGIRDKILTRGDDPAPLAVSIITVPTPELELAATHIARQWKHVGVRLNIIPVEIGELQNIIRARDYEMLLFGEILGRIPDPFPFWHSTQQEEPGLNLSRYKNTNVDVLLEEGRRDSEEERIEKYKQLQKLIAADIPAVFLYDPSYLYPVHKGIQGIVPTVIVEPALRFVGVEEWYIETSREF
jgi:peptide/nickel transport system substrate-binding protein